MDEAGTAAASTPAWGIGPFGPHPAAILRDHPELTFECPRAGRRVRWAAKDVFNPGAVVFHGKVHLLFRAEDTDDHDDVAGTSRIGLAVSEDGMRFDVAPEPVLYPADDEWQALEWPGGCEDPRVVESPDGGFVCTYTAFDGSVARLCVATSPDLRRWRKHGAAFAGTRHAARWSKSGAIVTELRDGRLVAARIGDRYWMYWGEGTCFAATSEDLVHWQPLEYEADQDRALRRTEPSGDAPARWHVDVRAGTRVLRPLLFPRRGRFDSRLVEPGPPAVLTDDGIVLVYNGANDPRRGDPALPAHAYLPAQALFDARDPTACIARAHEPFLALAGTEAQRGQVDDVCFAQALVRFGDDWFLYYGMADSRIGLAIASGHHGSPTEAYQTGVR